MRLNENIAVSTPDILLVPYDEHHVPTYHGWMQDPQIQEATASEPLTLSEEYENQLSWRESGDKLTFILCLPLPPVSSSSSSPKIKASLSPGDDDVDPPSRMIGDVNLFLTPWEEEEEEEERGGGGNKDDEEEDKKENKYCNAEIDIMIASPSHRGKGLGSAAVVAMLGFLRRNLDGVLKEYYGGGSGGGGHDRATAASSSFSSTTATAAATTGTATNNMRLRHVVAKINKDNEGSLALFRRLGFEARGEPNYFGELEMVLNGHGGGITASGHGDMDFETTAKYPWIGLPGYQELVWDRSLVGQGEAKRQ